MKSADHDIVVKIKADLARDSSYGAKMNAGYEYSNWYYVRNGHNLSLEHQKICAQKTINLLGLDVDAAVQVQNAVIHAYQVADRMLAVHETIQQHHLIASQAIQGQMLDQVQKQSAVHKGLPSTAPTSTDVVVYNSKEKLPASKISFGYQQNKAMAEFIKAIKESDVASTTKSIAFINSDIEDFDLSSFSQVFKYQSWNLNTVSFAGNKIKSPEYIFNMYSFGNTMHGKGVSIMHIDLSNNTGFGDDTAKWIANELPKGNMPALKVLDLHGTSMTKVGDGYFAKALQKTKQTIAVILIKAQDTTKEALQDTIKGLLFVAKNNGVVTKDAVTTYDTIQHCKKGFPNVAKNIVGGIANCVIPAAKYANPKDLTLQDVGLDLISLVIPETAPLIGGECIFEKVFFSVVDEEFSNCLVGLDSMLGH